MNERIKELSERVSNTIAPLCGEVRHQTFRQNIELFETADWASHASELRGLADYLEKIKRQKK